MFYRDIGRAGLAAGFRNAGDEVAEARRRVK
jgi:hypothetical protein